MATSQPHVVSSGIAFTVSVDFVKRDCVVSGDALAKLAEGGSGQTDWMQTFLAHEANISGTARRMAAAGVPGKPLQLEAKSLRLP